MFAVGEKHLGFANDPQRHLGIENTAPKETSDNVPEL